MRQEDAIVYGGGPEWLRMLDAAVCSRCHGKFACWSFEKVSINKE